MKPLSKKDLLVIKKEEENKIIDLVNNSLKFYTNSLLKGLPIDLVTDSFGINEASAHFIMSCFNSTDEWEVTFKEKRLTFKLKNENI
jgi:hypothetical protein